MKISGTVLGLLFLSSLTSTGQITFRKVSDELIFNFPPFRSCHASTIVQITHEKFMAAAFGGTDEGNKDVCIWLSTKENGVWGKPVKMADGIMNETLRYPCWNPVLFKAKEGKLFLFYKVGPSPSTWWGMVRTSTNDGKTWTSPERLPEGILGPIKNKPVQLANGTILSPSSSETKESWKAHIEKSTDLGRTWQLIPVDPITEFDVIQPSILIHPNNKLQILCRSKNNAIVQAYSENNGNTWGAFTKTDLPNPNSGTDAVTLKNGWHLLVYNPTIKGKGGRAKLNVAVSKDGIKWSDVVILENEEQGEFSYPAVIQAKDGKVHITYTYNRVNIKHVVLEEAKRIHGDGLKTNSSMNFKETQLTFDESGHSIHNYQVFSPDDQWIVYDVRNHDSQITSTGSIRMVNVVSTEIKEIYTTVNQSAYGPGVGAASFSPKEDRVIFIHGIRNATEKNPYGFTRRTGVAIDLKHSLQLIFMDARDVFNPFTPGALRGGTHAHSWSADGKWISFTYNDFIMEQLSKTDAHVKDLRTIGVMVPLKKVRVAEDTTFENNDGEMFSVVVAKVTETPAPGTDEIDRAFDECWIGGKGYKKANGEWQERAIAFQGNIITSSGAVKTECFIADLPADVSKAQSDAPLEGTETTRPNVPLGATQRRITHTENGMEGPRHWLRTTGDGSLIAFLMKDKKGIVQIFGTSPNGGDVKQLTSNEFPVQGQFNFSPDNKSLAYIADNSVFITDLTSGETKRITPRSEDEDKPVGGVVWSNNGKMLAYNRYVQSENGSFIQIFLLNI